MVVLVLMIILSLGTILKMPKRYIGIAIDINKFFIPDMIKKNWKHNTYWPPVSDEIGASVPYISSKSTLTGYVRALGNYLAQYNIKLSVTLPGHFLVWRML